jgi:hypothetical protein
MRDAPGIGGRSIDAPAAGTWRTRESSPGVWLIASGPEAEAVRRHTRTTEQQERDANHNPRLPFGAPGTVIRLKGDCIADETLGRRRSGVALSVVRQALAELGFVQDGSVCR